MNKPFDNFKTAIDDPDYFFGHDAIIEGVRHSPFLVRVLLGGRRMGKTSTLRAIEWTLLEHNNTGTRRAFPVFISLKSEQPSGLDNLRYILIARLREAIERFKSVPGLGIRQLYRSYRRQVAGAEVTFDFLKTINAKFKVSNPDYERRLIHDDFRQAFLQTIKELNNLNFEGICFLLDDADFIVSQEWANDVWSYFRGLKDTDTAIKPFLGLVLSGYRDLKDYQQEVGSPLFNIAQVEWLSPLTSSKIRQLINHRGTTERLSFGSILSLVEKWGGCHPYITHQMLNLICDKYCNQKPSVWIRPEDEEDLSNDLLRQHSNQFTKWWSQNQQSECFSENERSVYLALAKVGQGTDEDLVKATGLSQREVSDALQLLVGTGVVQQLDDERYAIGSYIFKFWVEQHKQA